MIIGIDIRALVLGRRTGIEEYVLNLLPRMIAQNPEITFRLFYNAWRKQKLGFSWLNASNVELCERSIPNRPLFISNNFLHWPLADKLLGGCDVFWSPHIFNVALSPDVRHIVTVHDLAFERYPHFFSKEKLWWHTHLMQPKRQLTGADRIIASSYSTSSDLVKLYGIGKDKISVVSPGVGEEFRPLDRNDPQLAIVRRRYGLPENFILYFGTIEPRKNIIGLIRAFELFKESHKLGDISPEVEPGSRLLYSKNLERRDYKLVIAGANGWLYKDIFSAATASAYKNDIQFTGFISNEDKPALYNLAGVFVYPSFFEGFGFPPLEAMACAIPVITSNRSSIPEVTGNAAILIDPYRPREIARALQTVLEDSNTKRSLVASGTERARQFRWEVCAERITDILINHSA